MRTIALLFVSISSFGALAACNGSSDPVEPGTTDSNLSAEKDPCGGGSSGTGGSTNTNPDASDACASLSVDECLDSPVCKPLLGGCDNPPPGVSCSPTYQGCVAE
jgi:hypothetical protein